MITSLVSELPSPSVVESVGEGLRIVVDAVGLNTEPFTVALGGVRVPSLPVFVGSDVVEAKRLDSEALLRLYGSRSIEPRGDLFGRCRGTLMLASESDS
jgi:hypothetical protein